MREDLTALAKDGEGRGTHVILAPAVGSYTSPPAVGSFLEPGASVSGGKLVLDGWDGVQLGYLPELDGATEVLLRFEDLTFTRPVERHSANTAVLAGDSDSWWVAVYRHNYTNDVGTSLNFDLGGYGPSDGLRVDVSDELVDHFASLVATGVEIVPVDRSQMFEEELPFQEVPQRSFHVVIQPGSLAGPAASCSSRDSGVSKSTTL